MKKTVLVLISLMLVFTANFFGTGVNAAKVSVDDLELTYINGNKYVTTFFDDFNDDQLSKYWQICDNYPRQKNYCIWDADMTSLDGNGNLVLSCDYDENGKLLTGAVRTKNKFYQKYGYYEIRVKLQSVGGFWSAFWLMPDRIDEGITGGGDGTEIDVFEAFDIKNKKINHAIHYDGYGDKHTAVGTAVTASDVYDGQYHTFSLDWNEDEYTFYIDGNKTYSIKKGQLDKNNNPVSISYIPSYLKISLESGEWTGLPDAEEVPDCILVDYVKVYQRADYYAMQNDVIGDLDYDCEAGIKDFRLLRKYLAKETDEINIDAADVDGDGKVTAKDALVYKMYLARIIDKF